MKKLKLNYQKELIEAGCDEAGRGCLAGPVFAAAVILPKRFSHPFLNDSKQLSEEERNELRPIIEKKAVAWAVAMVDHEEIDRINILKASFKAMHLAIDQLQARPGLLLIDGNRFTPYFGVLHQCIIQGDGKYLSIAAASVLAKTHRDEYMQALHLENPQYGWDQNKGYGTAFHRKQLKEHGMSPYHRKTFRWNKGEEEMEAVDELMQPEIPAQTLNL
ncbi:MAG: ribonuclease HII [Sphingobacteriales bacterium]|nr:MAG: ribonuclease HII [Sphingobacteriales bacterium]